MNLIFNLGGQELLLLFIIFGPFILAGIALIDIIRSTFKENDKIIWVLIVLLLPVIGPILYFIIGMSKKVKNTDSFDK